MEFLARGTKSLTCQYCNITFNKPYSLALHLLDHTEKENSCRHCGKSFMTRNDLHAHERTHTEGKIWDRNEHTYVMGGNYSPNKHTYKKDEVSFTIERTYKQDGISFPCRHCDKSFSTRKDLAFHIRSHRSFKVFGYQNSETFISKEDAVPTDPPVYTIDRKSPEKSLSCRHCGQSFLSKPDLCNHERVHDEVKSGLQGVEKKTFSCNQCNEKFSTQTGLTLHCRSVHPPTYACPHCSFECKKKSGLVIHVRIHSERKTYTCPYCEKTFKMFACYENHVRTHDGKDPTMPTTCSLCGEEFRSRTRLAAHLRLHGNRKTGRAVDLNDDSNESFLSNRRSDDLLGSRADLSSHLRSPHNDMPSLPKGEDLPSVVKDDKMPILQKEKDLTAHTASASKRFPCPICGLTFGRPRELGAHSRQHMETTHIPCGHCPLIFNKLQSLINHYRFVDLPEPFPCPICKKSFDDKGAVIRHLKVHRYGKPYSCDLCNKRFKLLCYLVKHCKRSHADKYFDKENPWQNSFVHLVKPDVPQVTSDVSHQGNSNVREQNSAVPRVKTDVPHQGNSVVRRVKSTVPQRRALTGEKPYACQHCGMPFSSFSHLRRHMISHSHAELYLCHQCDMTFTSTKDLNRHMQTHLEKLNICSKCNKMFKSKESLDRHVRLHSVSKYCPYTCDVCQKRFGLELTLKKHMSEAHSKEYECDECFKVLYSKNSLKAHMLSHRRRKRESESDSDWLPDS